MDRFFNLGVAAITFIPMAGSAFVPFARKAMGRGGFISAGVANCIAVAVVNVEFLVLLIVATVAGIPMIFAVACPRVAEVMLVVQRRGDNISTNGATLGFNFGGGRAGDMCRAIRSFTANNAFVPMVGRIGGPGCGDFVGNCACVAAGVTFGIAIVIVPMGILILLRIAIKALMPMVCCIARPFFVVVMGNVALVAAYFAGCVAIVNIRMGNGANIVAGVAGCIAGVIKDMRG